MTVSVTLAPKTTLGKSTFQVIASESGAPYSREQDISLSVISNPDFFLTTPKSQLNGNTVAATVNVDGQDGYTGTVNFSCSVAPVGPTCSVSPTSVSSFPGAATLNVSLGSAAAGTYTVSVTGDDGKTSHVLAFTFIAADFSFTVDTNVIVYGGTLNILNYSITALNGYSGTVSISCDASSMYAYAACHSDGPIGLLGRTSWHGSLYVSPGSVDNWNGSYPIYVTFADPTNGIVHSTTIFVTPQTFTFVADNPSTELLLYPGQVSDPVFYTIKAVNGFNQKIDIQPNCYLNCTITPQSIPPDGTPAKLQLTVTGPTVSNPNQYATNFEIGLQAQVNLPEYPLWKAPVGSTKVLLKDYGLSSDTLEGIYQGELVLVPGKTRVLHVKYDPYNGFNRPVHLGCPEVIGVGLHCSTDRTELLPGDIANFTFSADPDVVNSKRQLDIVSTSDLEDGREVTHTLSFTLLVIEFSLSLTPDSQTIPSGGSARFQLDSAMSYYYDVYFGAPLECKTDDPGVSCIAPTSIDVPGSVGVTVDTTDGLTTVGPHQFTITVSDFNTSVSVVGTVFMQGHDNITVTSPNGGELWASGTNDIKWNFQGDPGPTVKIELLKGAKVDRLIADNVPIGSGGTGVYSWAMPDNLPFSQLYKVRISSSSHAEIVDDSDTRVWMGKGLDFNFPNSQTVIHQGDYINIQYSWGGYNSVDFDLYKGGKFLKQLQHGFTGGYGGSCWCWSLIGYTGTDTPAGNDYTVVATPVQAPSLAVTSQPFTIGTGGINILYPKGGEIWHPGDTQTIQWTWSADHLNVGRELSLKLGNIASGRVITLSTDLGASGSGSYTFTVPQDFPPGVDVHVIASNYGPDIIGATSAGIAVGDYHSLKVNVTGNGFIHSTDGAVNCAISCSYVYNTGKSFTLQPMSPNFTAWTGGTCSGTGDCTFTLTSDVTIGATFGADDIAITTVGSAPSPIKAGNSAQFQISLASTPGFPSTAQLSCSGTPLGAYCTFDKNGISLSTAPTVVNVTVHTTGTNGTSARNNADHLFLNLFVSVSIGVCGIFFWKGRVRAGGLLMFLCCFAFLTSCGGGGGSSYTGGGGGGGGSSVTPAGNYQITVTAVAGSVTKSVSVPITVQ